MTGSLSILEEIHKKCEQVIALNDYPAKRWMKHKHLMANEPYPVMPANWLVKNINKYETFITWNRKFAETNKKNITAKIIVVSGGMIGDNISREGVVNFTSYDEKIKGVCLLAKTGHRVGEGNIYFLREEFMRGLFQCSSLETHIYSIVPYGGSCYQGRAPGNPWGEGATNCVSKYLFNFCPENTYHSMWSYGYLTEKLFRSFRAKTVPIYIGCYNIEDIVPKDLFIDFRDFYVPEKCIGEKIRNHSRTDYKKVAKFLESFPKEKYIEMTEKAFEWWKARGLVAHDKYVSILEKLMEKENGK